MNPPPLLKGKHMHSRNEMGQVTMATGYPFVCTCIRVCVFGCSDTTWKKLSIGSYDIRLNLFLLFMFIRGEWRQKKKNSIYLLKLPHHLVHYASCWCAVMGWFIRAPALEMCYLTANFSVSRRTDWKIHFALALRFTAVSLCSVLRLQQLTKLS